MRQQFTQKERDNETELDYFGARYYGSSQGRFTSPDPLLSSGRSLQLQSWNRYSYVINRLSLVDPKGLDWGVTEWDDKKGHHTNYHWFDGKIGRGPDGRSYTAVNFGKRGSLDVHTDNGQTVRISNPGIIRQVIYSGPAGDGPSNGQGNPLNMSAGLVDGAIPFGKQFREATFGKMGVDTSAPEYENASTISGGVTTGVLLLTGMGKLS